MNTDPILIFVIIATAAVGVWMLNRITRDDLDEAGVHLDDHNSLDLSKVYKAPIGFEPHGSRDTFVPTVVDSMSTDDFIESLRQSIEDGPWLGNARMYAQMKRAHDMLVDARSIMDEVLPCGHNEEVIDSITNWLIRGHQD